MSVPVSEDMEILFFENIFFGHCQFEALRLFFFFEKMAQGCPQNQNLNLIRVSNNTN